MADQIFTNARLVLPDAVVSGTVVVRDGRIVDVTDAPTRLPAVDLEGDILIPGIIDLHTDNLERQVQPRTNARWPSRSALMAHDAQCAAAGVTTVLDALCFGDLGFEQGRLQTCRDGVADLDAMGTTGLLKSEHFLHLRCELPGPDLLEMLEPVADHPRVRMASLMDHTPGVGQYGDIDYFRRVRRASGFSPDEIEASIITMQAQRDRLRGPNRQGLLARLAGRAIAFASHDDDSVEVVAENAGLGITISEFPTRLAAAQAAKRLGMAVIAGAPNLVRGGSHSGNVAAAELLDAGAADAFASDYVPSSLVEAAFIAADRGIGLPAAVTMITARPAEMVGLRDRGALRPGLRADLVRVHPHGGLPIVRQVWRAGARVI
jgi:alpha-D-ribose 1-methylphosphonate 5-triphosphate diphosphatase